MLWVAAAAGSAHAAEPGSIAGDLVKAQALCGDAALKLATPEHAAETTAAMLCLINAERRNVGVPPLREDPRLDRDARAYGDDLINGNDQRRGGGPIGTIRPSPVLHSGYRARRLFAWTSPVSVPALDGMPAGAVASWVYNRSRGDLLDKLITDVGLAAAFDHSSLPAAAGSYVGIFATEACGAPAAVRDVPTSRTRPVARAAAGAARRPAGRVVMLRDGKPITTEKVSVTLGAPIHLSVCPGDANARWSIQGVTHTRNTSALENFQIDDAGVRSSAIVAFLNLPDLPSTFYFVRPSMRGYRVTVTTSHGSVSRLFVVTAPSVKPSIDTCSVDLSHFAVQGWNIPAAWVGPGLNRSCIGKYGITWRYQVSAKPWQAGALSLIQLISLHKTHDNSLCETVDNAADQSAFYDSHAGKGPHPERTFVQLPGGGTATYWDQDAPHLSLIGKTEARYESFLARDFLMYKPHGGIWVPLGGVNWSWNARVSRHAILEPWHLEAWRDIGGHPLYTTPVDLPFFAVGYDAPQSACP